MSVSVRLNEPVVMIEGHRGIRPRRGEVVKIGRVWIEVQPEGWASGRTQRFRLDTQTDGSQIGAPPRFYTLEQWAERERQMTALQFLAEQGISISFNSPWRRREVELADVLRKAVAPVKEEQ